MILEFVSQNWYLFLMLSVIVLLLTLQPGAAGGTQKISPMQLPKLQNRDAAVVVDVCEAAAYKQGHIAQSINLPLDQLGDKINKLNKHKNKPIIVACQNGTKSTKAANILRGKEFNNLYILEGGLMAWRKENLPLVKG